MRTTLLTGVPRFVLRFCDGQTIVVRGRRNIWIVGLGIMSCIRRLARGLFWPLHILTTTRKPIWSHSHFKRWRTNFVNHNILIPRFFSISRSRLLSAFSCSPHLVFGWSSLTLIFDLKPLIYFRDFISQFQIVRSIPGFIEILTGIEVGLI